MSKKPTEAWSGAREVASSELELTDGRKILLEERSSGTTATAVFTASGDDESRDPADIIRALVEFGVHWHHRSLSLDSLLKEFREAVASRDRKIGELREKSFEIHAPPEDLGAVTDAEDSTMTLTDGTIIHVRHDFEAPLGDLHDRAVKYVLPGGVSGGTDRPTMIRLLVRCAQEWRDKWRREIGELRLYLPSAEDQEKWIRRIRETQAEFVEGAEKLGREPLSPQAKPREERSELADEFARAFEKDREGAPARYERVVFETLGMFGVPPHESRWVELQLMGHGKAVGRLLDDHPMMIVGGVSIDEPWEVTIRQLPTGLFGFHGPPVHYGPGAIYSMREISREEALESGRPRTIELDPDDIPF